MGTSRAAEGRLDRDARLHEQQMRFEGSGQTAVSGSLRALFTAAPGWPNMTPRSTRWRNEDGYQQSSGR